MPIFSFLFLYFLFLSFFLALSFPSSFLLLPGHSSGQSGRDPQLESSSFLKEEAAEISRPLLCPSWHLKQFPVVCFPLCCQPHFTSVNSVSQVLVLAKSLASNILKYDCI